MTNEPTAATGVALGVEELRRRALMRLVERFRSVGRVVGPLLFAFVAWILYTDGTAWRWALLLVTVGAGLALKIRLRAVAGTVAARFCQRDFRPHEALHFVCVHLLLISISGGLASPLLPVLFAGAYNAALFGNVAAARMVFACHIAGIWTLLAIHLTGAVHMVPTTFGDAFGWPGDLFLAVVAAAMTVTLSVAHLMGLRMREAVDEQLEQAVVAREAALGNYRERADELTTLSAEIAHELKNPLATVKGLAALLGKDASGKTAERLGVLRREVDRMQGILDEFLNFSRPLAPLTVRRVDLSRLVREVVDLHEGIASDRRIELRLDAEHGMGVACDPRKIKQILVNLLQNALDAADSDTAVDLVVRRIVDTVEVQVLDHGPGVPAALTERVFEAGMTTKANGNGLGLPMARALARQHGGDLRLEDRVDGPGCAAVMRLPIHGPRLADPLPSNTADCDSRDELPRPLEALT
ncbi:MAG: HAMP domain-containing histidine kinase [Deltaproteobacteria bacterium]|nr:HAMP domain-containing histidine kinase [Nannocystaceae bacterium]